MTSEAETSVHRAHDVNTLNCYDVGGNLVSVTAPRAGLSSVTCPASTSTPFTTVYGYDADHRLTSVADPLNHLTQLGYDQNSNRTQVTDANNNATTLTYDALNRLVQTDQAFIPAAPRTQRSPAGESTTPTAT